MPFEKIEASGNDFILLLGADVPETGLTAAVIAELCHRHYGLGADGVLVWRPEERCLDHYDPDGARSFCLNGARGALDWLYQTGRIDQKGTVVSEDVTLGYSADRHLRLHLPKATPVPALFKPEGVDQAFFVDVGNPQYVIVDQLSRADFLACAPRIRHDDRYQHGVNVNLIQSHQDPMRITTFERGVEDITLACGSGMLAAALVLFAQRDLARVAFQPDGRGVITVTRCDDHIAFEGPSRCVAKGEWLC